MITANVIHRIFRIKYNEAQGTAFTVDVSNRQYLITAKHLVSTFRPNEQIFVSSNFNYIPLQARLVGHCVGDIDISVFSINCRLTPPKLPMEVSNEIVYGQDVFFLGFPYDLESRHRLGEEGYPLPFVKKATVACFDGPVYYLDGHNNIGFSGGPVVFKPDGSKEFRVVGVISGYKSVDAPIYDEKQEETRFTYEYNIGIIRSYAIKPAIEIIKANPIGFCD